MRDYRNSSSLCREHNRHRHKSALTENHMRLYFPEMIKGLSKTKRNPSHVQKILNIKITTKFTRAYRGKFKTRAFREIFFKTLVRSEIINLGLRSNFRYSVCYSEIWSDVTRCPSSCHYYTNFHWCIVIY